MSKSARTLAPLVLVLAALLAPIPSAAGQTVIGHSPENSPFRDIHVSQQITLFGGYFKTHTDGLGIEPSSAPTFGIRYSLPVAGPADFYVRAQRIGSHRNSYNPTLVTDRSLGEVSQSLLLGDLGFDFNLTGRKTWHHMIPVIGFGIGIATSGSGVSTSTAINGASAADPYDFGTGFAFSGEFALRIIPGNSVELRLSATPTWYQSKLPAEYYVIPSGGTAVLPASTPRSGFRSAMDYTVGLSIPIFR